MNFDKDEYIEDLWSDISNLLSDYDLYAGISFKFSKLINLNTFYNQAKKSYMIGKANNLSDNMYFFKDYYTSYLLDYLNKEIDLEIYCHKGLLKLLQFDEEHNTEYLNTLREYFNNQFNLTETARKLYIHKNTMLHRKQRITEISGIDFSKNIDMFRLHLTFNIIDYNQRKS
jgi:DNA-binding PucR family transcriptional regulator